jgi:GLPGLI family protein
MRIFYIITALISFSFSEAQKSGIITYSIANVTYDKSITNIEVLATYAAAERMIFTLTFNSSESTFEMQEKLDDESNQQNKFFISLARFETSHNYYVNKKSNKQLVDKQDGVLVQSNLTKFDWQLQGDSKMIGAYLCYKAIYSFGYIARNKKTYTSSTTAWFCPILPFAYGPKNYYGLPGLILELQVDDVTFLATNIKLINHNIDIKIPNGKIVQNHEYLKTINNQ